MCTLAGSISKCGNWESEISKQSIRAVGGRRSSETSIAQMLKMGGGYD